MTHTSFVEASDGNLSTRTGLAPAGGSRRGRQLHDKRRAGPGPPASDRQPDVHHAAIPYNGDAKKKGRRFFTGETHGRFNLEVHETILGAGVETHAPHRHLHEEIIVVVEGTVETYVDGKTDVLAPGSVIWYASNQMHSARNVGTVPARYYVIELRGDENV